MAKSKKKVPPKGTPKDVRAGGKGLPPKSGMKVGNKFGKGKAGC
jgi:hypothetical protein